MAGAGLEVGGGDVVLTIAYLQLEVAEAELQDGVEGGEVRPQSIELVRGPPELVQHFRL